MNPLTFSFSTFCIATFVIATSVITSGCSNERLVGERSDGLKVECEEVEAETFECEPIDGDDECEDWNAGGPAFVLWPPNHKMVTIDVGDCLALADACLTDGNLELDGWVISAVTADEPIEVGRGGDGNTSDYDMLLTNDTTVMLRSERQGGSDGRVYTVELVNEVLGNEFDETISCQIHVPHNRGPYGGAVDSGEAVRVER